MSELKRIGDLSPQQYKLLLKEYFAPEPERSKMNEAEIRDLAERLNKKINVPLIKETREEKILIKIVLKVDRFLYNNLPNELYDLIRSADKGIDDNEAKRLINRLTKLANDKIDIPYLTESMERIAIRFIISVIINAARKLFIVKTASDELAEMVIPSKKNLLVSEAETMLIHLS